MSFRRIVKPMPLAAACAVCAITPLVLVSSPIPPAQMPDQPRQRASLPAIDGALGKPGVTEADTGNMIPQRDWLDWPFLEKLLSSPPAPPIFAPREEPRPAPPRKPAPPASYRTMCVRLCDGFYWPISYATSRSRAKQDAERCERSCPGRARLFQYKNPGEEVEAMVDLKGRRYLDHPQAFLYRTEYVPDCTCRGHPWEEEARARHRAYAEAAARKASALGR
jgi:hypothetical protein